MKRNVGFHMHQQRLWNCKDILSGSGTTSHNTTMPNCSLPRGEDAQQSSMQMEVISDTKSVTFMLDSSCIWLIMAKRVTIVMCWNLLCGHKLIDLCFHNVFMD
jgi:hypothetical protein